jgi:hypothetical protein
MARAGWERVQTLDWSTQAAKLEAVYGGWLAEWQGRRK